MMGIEVRANVAMVNEYIVIVKDDCCFGDLNLMRF